jgi:hypothetical protein
MKSGTLLTDPCSANGGMPLVDSVEGDQENSIRLASCSGLEWIEVKTTRSVYDLVVLCGDASDVLIRGGRYFPEFRRATVFGSVSGPGDVRLQSICVGMKLAVDDGEKPVVTSRIEAVSRRPFPFEPEP